MLTILKISCCLIGVALVRCADNNAERSATIIREDFDNDGLGEYKYEFETSNGIKQSEQSSVTSTKNVEELLIQVVGSYSYPGTDGKQYEVRYVANASGFYPTGDHIKVPPVVPWPSQVSLDDGVSIQLDDSSSSGNVIQTDSDQGSMSTTADEGVLNISNENSQSVNVSNIEGGINISELNSGTHNTVTKEQEVQSTYLPPSRDTYLPPHIGPSPLIAVVNTPKNINQLLDATNSVSENQKREANYDMINPNSEMNKFAKPSNVIYFILKPKAFSVQS